MNAVVARLILRLALAVLTLPAPLLAMAQGDPPGRVGRVADLKGGVWMFDIEQGQWEAAVRNRPLTQGDRLSTDASGRAEFRIGSTTLRLASASELEVRRLDDEGVVLQLQSGSVALRVRSADVAAETEVVTAEARLQPQRAGHFRIDRVDDTTVATSWRGELRVLASAGAPRADEAFVIDNGRRAEIWREGRAGNLRHSWSPASDDAFSNWAQREDQRQDERDGQRTASSRYVSPEMTGAEDLDRNGRWEQHPDYGAVWVPLSVQPDWAPYRDGRWAWVQPWGWTWVDDAPWGFAPFHYGRWVNWRGRWCWTPGTYVARPVYAPALVAWVGGPRLGGSIQLGGPPLPTVGWLPLAPRDVYRPDYHHSREYRDRIDHRLPANRGGRPPEQVPTGPVAYGNEGVPGAVTVVPRDVLVQRQPVARAVVGDGGRAGRGNWARGELAPAAPPSAPVRAQPDNAARAPAGDVRPPNDDAWRSSGRPQGQRERPPLPQAIGAPSNVATPAVSAPPAQLSTPAVVGQPVVPAATAPATAPLRPGRDNERQRWPDERQRQQREVQQREVQQLEVQQRDGQQRSDPQGGEAQRRDGGVGAAVTVERGGVPAGAAIDQRQQRDQRPALATPPQAAGTVQRQPPPAGAVQQQPALPRAAPPQPSGQVQQQPATPATTGQPRPAPAAATPPVATPMPAPAATVVVPRPAPVQPAPAPAAVVRPPEQQQRERDEGRVRTPESRANMREREQVR